MKTKRTLIAFIVVIILIGSINLTVADDFIFYIDTFEHWAFDTIMWVSNDVELFNGYEDGTFKPDNNVRISEYLTLLYRASNLQGTMNQQASYEANQSQSEASKLYTDLNENHWAYNEMMTVIQYIDSQQGSLSFKDIFPGDTLDPGRSITREEAVVLSSFFASPTIKENKVSFIDIDTEYQYFKQLNKMVGNKIIEGYDDNSFRPENYITRAESAVILKKLYHDMEYLKGKYLHDIELLNKPKYKKYMLFGDYDKKDLTYEDKLYRRAISTIEYVSIIRYIPYEERHLYDPDPIRTLQELRASGYWNVVGTNYHLLNDNNWDDSIYSEIYNEMIEDYINRDDINDEESLLIFDMKVEDMTSFDKTIAALDKWHNEASSNIGKYNALFVKSKIYLVEGKTDEALGVYSYELNSKKGMEPEDETQKLNNSTENQKEEEETKDTENMTFKSTQNTEINQGAIIASPVENTENVNLFEEDINVAIKKAYIMNKSYILLISNMYEEAEMTLREGWKNIRTDLYNDEFTGALKEVLLHSSENVTKSPSSINTEREN